VATAFGQVSLLRGINVGGRTMVAMDRVRSIYEAMGLGDVRTHLHSGNVIFRSGRDPDGISIEAEAALRRELGLKIGYWDERMPSSRASSAGTHFRKPTRAGMLCTSCRPIFRTTRLSA
jgi:hypothetical protein